MAVEGHDCIGSTSPIKGDHTLMAVDAGRIKSPRSTQRSELAVRRSIVDLNLRAPVVPKGTSALTEPSREPLTCTNMPGPMRSQRVAPRFMPRLCPVTQQCPGQKSLLTWAFVGLTGFEPATP